MIWNRETALAQLLKNFAGKFGRQAVLLLSVVALLFIANRPASAGTPQVPNFIETNFASGVGQVTSLAWAKDGSNTLFLCQKGGGLRVVRNGILQATPVTTVTVVTPSECGLIGLCVDPNYSTNKYLYVFATVNSTTQQILRITVGTDASGNLVQTERIQIGPNLPCKNVNHDGGGMAIGQDGFLYWGVGNLGNGNNVGGDGTATEWTSLGSKIGRMNRTTGAAISSNPWYEIGNPTSVKSYTFAKGLRNPFGLTFQPGTSNLWLLEVGDQWEQIFRVLPGTTQGWPTENNTDVTNGKLIPKLAYRTNQSTYGGCITRGLFYNGTTFPSEYQGNLFFCDYNSGKIMRSIVDTSGNITSTAVFVTGNNGLTDITVGPDGALYYGTLGTGNIWRLQYTSVTPQNIILSATTATVNEAASATFTVKLAAAPSANVAVSVARTWGTTDVTPTPATLTFTSTNWSTAQTVTVAAIEDADAIDEGATIQCSATDLISQNVVVTLRDNDRSTGSPRATITQPRNGDIVNGTTAEFFGDGLDDVACTKGEFYIDGVLKYTDTNTTNHFHIGGNHNLWNTSTLSNGSHTLQLKVYDANGLSGTHQITVVKAPANGWYRLTPGTRSTACLGVSGNLAADKTMLTQQTWSGLAGQKWNVTLTSGGWYRLTPGTNSASCAEVQNGTAAKSTPLWTDPFSNANAQLWSFELQTNGTYRISSKLNPIFVMDIAAASTADGAKVQIYNWNKTVAQRWTLTSTTAP